MDQHDTKNTKKENSQICFQIQESTSNKRIQKEKEKEKEKEEEEKEEDEEPIEREGQ